MIKVNGGYMMERFRGTKLIVAQGKEVMQLDSIEELVDKVLGEEYRELSEKDKLQKRYENALLQAMFNNVDIVYSSKGIINKDKTFDKQTPYDINKSFVIDDDFTFLLSLCKVNDLRVLERIDSNIFISDEDREELKNEAGNYIIVNERVDKIMNRHINIEQEKSEMEKE